MILLAGLLLGLCIVAMTRKAKARKEEEEDRILVTHIDVEKGYGEMSLNEENNVRILYKDNGYVFIYFMFDVPIDFIEGYGMKPLRAAYRKLDWKRLLTREEREGLLDIGQAMHVRFVTYKRQHPTWVPNSEEEIIDE